MRSQPLVFRPALLDAIPHDTPGIYTLVGGRQVGKSTLCKQFLADRLASGAAPERLAYVTCEPFVDAEDLRRVLTDLLAELCPARERCWLLLDEVTYVEGWDRVVKFLADAGQLDTCFLLATGSDRMLIEDSLKRLPGRRGPAEVVDFHLRPLSFLEFCGLRGRVDPTELRHCSGEPLAAAVVESPFVAGLEAELRDYHLTGGFLPAINDLARTGEITTATFRTYADWIRGDVLRLDRSERYLREVLTGIHRRQSSQVTWNAFAKELSIDSPKTVADYLTILERMDVLQIVPALVEHTGRPAPKKARKVYFADPFIHRAALSWLGEDDQLASDARLQRDLEGVFAAHVARIGEGFYIKADGEIDVAFYERRELQLVEVKWSSQLRPEELKEIRRRGRGLIAARVARSVVYEELPVLPAAVVLLRLAARAASH
ncbi:MAG: ATP-binding protein [Planctomycetes bacterium]|nr:ATP-binding protein [Planctomycetota bacterium]MCB9885549.1 ATP-binding protein [Planctomycetota bacterium]